MPLREALVLYDGPLQAEGISALCVRAASPREGDPHMPRPVVPMARVPS